MRAIMLALYARMLQHTYYARKYASIIRTCLVFIILLATIALFPISTSLYFVQQLA